MGEEKDDFFLDRIEEELNQGGVLDTPELADEDDILEEGGGDNEGPSPPEKKQSFSAEMFTEKPSKRFPFPAIVGQGVLKRALLLNIVNPGVGGLLVRGEKGTGKSVTVRALADILPNNKVVVGCKFNCDPEKPGKFCRSCKDKQARGDLETEHRPMRIVYLPLNITEDMLVGAIDMERVLSEGVTDFEPGLLADAHRNVLYIDEINLLEDNIVDLLLDAAAMGVVSVEREGISFSYSSEFILIGSMNPQEGELRPQLLDRLALQAESRTITILEKRVEIMKNSRNFVEDPNGFREEHFGEIESIKETLEKARRLLPEVTTSSRMLSIISQICIDFDIDGHRGDIIIERTARTNAALDERSEVTAEDVVVASEMALPHRMRKQPFEEDEFNKALLHKLVREYEKTGVA